MSKEMQVQKENLIATLFAIYAILLTLCWAIYAFIEIYALDKSLVSNLLVWSATLFAPIVVLFLIDSWKDQELAKKIEVCADDTWICFEQYKSEVSEISYQIGKFIEILQNKESEINDEVWIAHFPNYKIAIERENEFYKSLNRLLLRVDVENTVLTNIRSELFLLVNILISVKNLRYNNLKEIKKTNIISDNSIWYQNVFELEKKFKIFIRKFIKFE